MHCIIISHENPFEGESDIINLLFHAGMDNFHLRKPAYSKEILQNMLWDIEPAYHSRIVLHDHFELAKQFSLAGVHLNSRNPVCPPDAVAVSCGCHSLACLNARQSTFNGLIFLSPVFDSISKAGYKKAFTDEELSAASKNRIINRRIIALGGMSAETIPVAGSYGFGGVAVLGALWGNNPVANDKNRIVDKFLQLKELTNQ
ncbi:MAG: thiamine phosphate synthase [Bacteroidales bacterium]|jgi:thiamine-phosphate pyrophosphorylase|nr:thiamine phosphate synthase [Bacteroidales bacterium]